MAPQLEEGLGATVIVENECRAARGYEDVPALTELDLSEENLAHPQAHSHLREVGRMFFGPPGMTDACREELTAAVGDALQHPDVDAQVRDMGR